MSTRPPRLPDFSDTKHSGLMSKIRKTGNRSTELRAESVLVEAGITEWEKHAPILGKPDFYFPRYRLALFIDGCYWHGCTLHGNATKVRPEYWQAKIDYNRRRDRRVQRQLRAQGYHVMRVWEHDLRRDTWLKRLRAMLRRLEARYG